MPVDLVYVSWGGTGRAATLRAAMRIASRIEGGLVYLAVIDEGTFDDLDDSMVDLIEDELEWLLEAQIELTRRQLNIDEKVRVVIRRGDVDDRVVEMVEALGETSVLIGAPAATTNHESVAEMIEVLRSRTGRPVELVEPELDLLEPEGSGPSSS